MIRLLLATSVVASCLVMAAAGAQAQSPGPKSKVAAKKTQEREPVPGYKYRQIGGFHLLVENKVLEENETSTKRRKPLEVLELELTMLENDLPPRALNVLYTIPIWVEWNFLGQNGAPGSAVAVYHAGNKLNKRYRFDSMESFVKSNCVEIVDMQSLTNEHQGDTHRCVLLHEIAHAVHHHLFDYDHPGIKSAYAQAMSKGLYAGQYAASSEKEYFAELSCAYFDHLHYTPHTREELKTYDPVGYHMMELTWGTPEEIKQAQRPEKEKNAMLKYSAARKLSRDKRKVQEAIDSLESLVRDFPDTRAAVDAKKLLEKLQPEPK